MLTISPEISIEESELQESFIRASGPGGQNVNKVAMAVQLRFDIANSQSLSPVVRERLRRVAGKRVAADGVLVIEARRFRTQEQNRDDARARLGELVRQALYEPKKRRATKPTPASKERRLENKRKVGQAKKLRRGSLD